MPCKFSKATEALERVENDGLYDFSPLSAMTDDGKPIPPNEYEHKLLRATVLMRDAQLRFLSFQRILYADVASITVLRRPPVIAISPHVKSPSKRRRFDLPDLIKMIKRRI
jgi:hypothetical protein